ncbi:multidrug resistance-associated ABC transporter [Ramaria rubella]|nr:multidrug resistance-associated ABC transporter [Ramaria rubella]
MFCSAPGGSWTDPCTRSYFESVSPLVLISLVLCLSIPLPPRIAGVVKPTFTRFLPLNEAEALLHTHQPPRSGEPSVQLTRKSKAPLWRTVCLSGLALAEATSWLGISSYRLALLGRLDYRTITPFFSFLSWLPAIVVPVVRPKVTPPFDLFVFYLFQLGTGAFRFGTIWYDHETFGIPPVAWTMVGTTAHLMVVLALLTIVVRMPLNAPNEVSSKEKIPQGTPEDYASLWNWITFEWTYPLIKKGKNQTLNETDVWDLSPTMQCKALYLKFATITRKTLFRRIWAANSYDLTLDFLMTIISITFNYAGPFFLKRILDSLSSANQNNSEARSRAYIYAFLAFLCAICRSLADLLHIWFGRRATTRVRSELMASIFAKAVVRKDYSGIIDKKTEGPKIRAGPGTNLSSSVTTSESFRSGITAPSLGSKQKQKEQEWANSKESPKNQIGADIGKITNLMSGDASSISNMIGGAYIVYGAPFEIAIASIFLYQLLGLSAFAGFICLVVASPLNSFLAKRNTRIQKGLLAARDKRMGIVNELLSAVKLVKFYGWENRWIERVLDARKFELGWLSKRRINQVMLSMLWTTAPILVSVVSFLTFVMSGHELTVPVAFTSIALFNMLRAPLNVVPTWIIQMLQTAVALDRIETFLDEDEVSPEISSVKSDTAVQGRLGDGDEDSRLGIKHASFKWNEIEEQKGIEPSASAAPSWSSASLVVGSGSDSDDLSEGTSVTIREPEERRFELRDIDVIFPEGKLSVIAGPTASGKTALLMALLGEMTMLPGNGKLLLPKHPKHIDKNGYAGISYAAQAPFLQHQTIRENILFGTPYDEKRYEAVLENCALYPDLAILENGDLTEVGSRGISLSGGQKARVALARAVYARSKCVLLDDPLSAVDSHTALCLYERLLMGPLLANRTVVLVTHNVELVLPGAHYLVRLLDGRIDVQGITEDLRKQGLLDAITKDSPFEQKVQARKVPPKVPEAERTNEEKKTCLVKDEVRATGNVKLRIYKTYMRASSYWVWATIVCLICLYQLLGVVEKLWIKLWGEAYPQANAETYLLYSPSFSSLIDKRDLSIYSAVTFTNVPFSGLSNNVTYAKLPSADVHPLFYVAVYATISFGVATIGIINIVVQYTGGLRASRLLFKQLLIGVVRATMRWHDSTPTGRILNRFGKDIENIDTSLSSSLQSVNSSIATFIAAVATVVFFSPPFIIPAVVLGYVYYRLGMMYLTSGRDLCRMEANSRSPLFSTFSELLAGIVTVRAFSSERRFLDCFHSKVDASSKMRYSFKMTNRWLSLRFDILGGIAVLFATLLALSGAIGAGLAGVTITAAMAFTSAVFTTCRSWTQLELDLNAVERVVEYLEIPQEPPVIIESNRPPAYWPSNSNNDSLVVVEDLVVRYAPDLPAVLHGISFALKARERIGLLGRTGSGKSTLAMSLLRFTDPSSGSIKIDGIDITSIGLQDLRSRLTFVAQDAVLFSGTIRENLDPFGDYSDEECRDALARVHLLSESAYSSIRPSRASSISRNMENEDNVSSAVDEIVEQDKQGTVTLETQVSAGGSNFSQGQRQLLTMARALLRQSAIIILDEATSSIDYETDAKIQTTIREEFKNSLLLTVAHRLRTVIDYDRLIILDNGRIVEFDTPFNLIHSEGSVFREMCMHSGTFPELEVSANKAAATKAKYSCTL